MYKKFICLCLVQVAVSSLGDLNNDSPDTLFYEEITIVGAREAQQGVTGSAQVIDADQLKRFGHTDIQRIARQVPGVSIQVEDGYGLRPNISIRGVATERSGRITLLEDNVLIAPAPYSAPSAYYFPTAGRMSSFEVLKGPSAITQGPYTIGGALNMVSTPIPREVEGRIAAEIGQDESVRVHATYGDTSDDGFGFLIETQQWRSAGYQKIDRSGRETGLDVADYTLKAAYSPNESPHSLAIKIQLADQTSNQSYLGLTNVDFNRDAERRYGLSSLDQIRTDHEQVILRYGYDAEALSFSATAYNNTHARNWFKTEGIDLDGSDNASVFSKTSWSSVVSAVNRGQAIGDWSAEQLASVLDGSLDTALGSIQIRANEREYFSRGIQLMAVWDFNTSGASHRVEAGLRYHKDEEDRLQRNSTYHQEGGELELDDLGLLGNAGNRIQQADAIAFHLYDRIEVGPWTLTPGIRFEDIDQRRVRYEIRAGRTENPASRSPNNLRSTRSNTTRVVLPGVGALYRVNQTTALIAGIHKGFTAPSNAEGVQEEEALNYEIGVRHQSDSRRVELIGFLSDYDNLLGECTASSGSNCEVGDAFNGNAVTVRGIEFLAGTELAGSSVPVELSYTYIDGSFDTDIADTAFFGDVNAGDPIPYIPRHQLHAMIGFVQTHWAVHLSANFVDETCVRAACGAFEITDSSFTVDVAGRWSVNDNLGLFARVENLADSSAIVGLHPYGARPNKSRTALVGLDLSF